MSKRRKVFAPPVSVSHCPGQGKTFWVLLPPLTMPLEYWSSCKSEVKAFPEMSVVIRLVELGYSKFQRALPSAPLFPGARVIGRVALIQADPN